METLPEIKLANQKNEQEPEKKKGFWNWLLSKLGLRGASGAGSQASVAAGSAGRQAATAAASSAARSGGQAAAAAASSAARSAGQAAARGLFQSGILATKAGMMAASVIGVTVAAGAGYLGYKMMTAQAPASAPAKFDMAFEKPKSVPAPAKPQATAPLDSLSVVNEGQGIASKPPPPEAVAEAGGSPSAAPAAPAPQAAAPEPAPAGSTPFTPGSLASDKQFGNLSNTTGDGRSGASAAFGKKPGAVPNAAQAAKNLAFAREQAAAGRASLSRNRGGGGRAGGAFRQLGNLSNQSRGATNLRSGGSATVDGGVSMAELEGDGGTAGVALGENATIGAQSTTDGGGGGSGGSSGVGDIPGANTKKEVTPWKKDIMTAAAAIILSALALYAAITALQAYYEAFMEVYNRIYMEIYARTFRVAVETCGTTMQGCIQGVGATAAGSAQLLCTPSCHATWDAGLPYTAAPLAVCQAGCVTGQTTVTTGATEASTVARGAALAVTEAAQKVADANLIKQVAKATAAQTKAAGILAGGAAAGTAPLAAAAGSGNTAIAAEKQAEQIMVMTAATAVGPEAAVAANGSALASYTTLCESYGFAICADTPAIVADCIASATLGINACTGAYTTCMAGAATTAQSNAMTETTARANSETYLYKVGALALAGIATLAAATAGFVGTEVATGGHNQPLQGWALAAGGAIMTVMSAWVMTQCATPVLTPEDAGATSGAMTVQTTAKLATFAEIPTIMLVGGGAALLGAGVAALSKPKTIECDDAKKDCSKQESRGSLSRRDRDFCYPSEAVLKEFLS